MPEQKYNANGFISKLFMPDKPGQTILQKTQEVLKNSGLTAQEINEIGNAFQDLETALSLKVKNSDSKKIFETNAKVAEKFENAFLKVGNATQKISKQMEDLDNYSKNYDKPEILKNNRKEDIDRINAKSYFRKSSEERKLVKDYKKAGKTFAENMKQNKQV